MKTKNLPAASTKSPLTGCLVSRTAPRKGPLEEADHGAVDPVEPALGGESPRGAVEPAGATRDGRGLHDVNDIRVRGRGRSAGEVCLHLVAVGCCELVGTGR